MAQSKDLLFQNLSTVHSDKLLTPTRIDAATVISPKTFLTFLVGTTSVQQITPPIEGAHLLAFVRNTNSNFTTGSNINSIVLIQATTTTGNNVDKIIFMAYDPQSARYYPGISSDAPG